MKQTIATKESRERPTKLYSHCNLYGTAGDINYDIEVMHQLLSWREQRKLSHRCATFAMAATI